MAKRSKRQESAKTSKKEIVENKKLQKLNSLIKVLRPKVYITDTSGFKRLVQELTGNTDTCPSPEITAGQDSLVVGSGNQGSSADRETIGKESSSSVDSLGFDNSHQLYLNPNYVELGGMKFMVGNSFDDGLFMEENDRYYQDQSETWVFDQSEQYCYNHPANYDLQEVSLFEFNHDHQFSAAEILSSDVFLWMIK